MSVDNSSAGEEGDDVSYDDAHLSDPLQDDPSPVLDVFLKNGREFISGIPFELHKKLQEQNIFPEMVGELTKSASGSISLALQSLDRELRTSRFS